MRQLLNLFIKYHRAFLFIILEFICFILIVRNHHFQRTVYLSSANKISGEIFELSSSIGSFFRLQSINDKLLKENTILKNQNSSLRNTKDTLNTYIDSIYVYRNAHIINKSVNKLNNTITLDKGALDGIKKEMGVVCHNGVVGIISSVSNHFSTVLPIINQDLRVSAKIKKNNFYGSLWWDGKSYKQAILNDIPFHAEVVKGDSIITSGYSSIFPENIPIATVENIIHDDGDNFLSIKVNLIIDFKNLDNVYIIENKLKAEQKELESKLKND